MSHAENIQKYFNTVDEMMYKIRNNFPIIFLYIFFNSQILSAPRFLTTDTPSRTTLILKYLHLYLQIFTLCVRKKVPFITFWIFSLSSQPCKILIKLFIVLNPGIICTFLIHSGGLQKRLTALFNLVWNTQKSKRTIFFESPGKMFLSIEKV